ncbi:MAG: hypothetical protein P4L99_21765 [Chthoniobacter sp.]|nr:hypothetical protein [Chthoniobacter sp.]
MTTRHKEGTGLAIIGWVIIVIGLADMVFSVMPPGTSATGFAAGASAFIGGVLIISLGRLLALLGEIADNTSRAPQLAAPEYFYDCLGEVRGPVPMHHLLSMRALTSETRTVTGETLVCQTGQKAWVALKNFDSGK